MARQASAQQPMRQYLNVKHNVAHDSTLMPYRIDMDDEEYAVEVLRSREIYRGRWRYTVKVDKREMYLHREGEEWWVE